MMHPILGMWMPSNFDLYNMILSTMQGLIMQKCHKNYESPAFNVRNTWHVESHNILQLPKYLIIIVNRLRYINNSVTKDRCSIRIWPLCLVSINSSCMLPLIITDHLRILVIILPLSTVAKYILLQRQQNYCVWNEWHHEKHSYI